VDEEIDAEVKRESESIALLEDVCLQASSWEGGATRYDRV